MYRFHQLAKLTDLTSRILFRPAAVRCLNFPHYRIIQNRFYSKDSKDKKVISPNDTPCDAKKPSKSQIILKECKPVNIHPCKPDLIPNLEQCVPLHVIDKCPPPVTEPPAECVYKEPNRWGTYKNAALLGLLIAAATLGTLYQLGAFDSAEKAIVEAKKKKRERLRDPISFREIPTEVPYLLIGGGTASFAAFRAIKSADPTAKVLVVTEESFHPYMRPPLSKEMWFNEDLMTVRDLKFKQWNGTERNLLYEPQDFYIQCKEFDENPNGGVAVARGYKVSHVNVEERIARLCCGVDIHYGKCLIATGARPKNLNVFNVVSSNEEISSRIKLFRNIYDFDDIYETFEENESIAVIGGGFLGSELACALARKGKEGKKEIYQIFRESGNMGKILPEYLSTWTTEKVAREGVQVHKNIEIVGVKYNSEIEKLVLILSDEKELKVDQVIVAVGVEPNTAMAEKSNLEIDPDLGGFLVNTELMARSNLYIAGDCACFYDAKLGRRRIEHHDNAVVTGRLAGENMAGGAKPYLHQSMFWSDLGPDVGYEAIGIVDAALPTVGVFAKASGKDTPASAVSGEDGQRADKMDKRPVDRLKQQTKVETSGDDYGKGVIFYLRDDIVVGIVLWNVFNRMSIARQVLKDEKKYEDLNEVAKLFNIHED